MNGIQARETIGCMFVELSKWGTQPWSVALSDHEALGTATQQFASEDEARKCFDETAAELRGFIARLQAMGWEWP